MKPTSSSGQLAAKTLLWNQTSAVSGLAGGSVNVGAQLVKTGEVDLKEAGVATLTSMAGGGAAAWATNTKAVAPLAAQGIALTGVVATNAAGAVVTGSPQDATAGGAIVGYASGQAPGLLGTLGGPMMQEVVTWFLSVGREAPVGGSSQAGRGR